VYAPQVGRSLDEKEEFLVLVGKTISNVNVKERLVVAGDFNCHVGAEALGFEGVHGGHGFGRRNVEGEMLLELASALGLVVVNTCFTKRDSQKVTFESAGMRTVVDYVLVRRQERAMVLNVKVICDKEGIPEEPILLQHRLIVCDLVLKERVIQKLPVFESRCKVWKLKDVVVRRHFVEQVEKRAADRCVKDVDGAWNGLKSCLLEVSDNVCGKSKGRPRHKETWWWSEEVSKAVDEKRKLFKVWRTRKTRLAEEKYKAAKKVVSKLVHEAQEAERRKLVEKLEEADGKGSVFRVVKQMVRTNRDVVGDGCIKDERGKIVAELDKCREVWRKYFEQLLNEEFAWDRDSLEEGNAIAGPAEEITVPEVRAAISKMKAGKAVGPSGVGAEMLTAAGEAGVLWVTDLCNLIVKEGRVPADWSKSWVVTVYKGKGDALECGSYRGIKLLDQVMKVFERVIEVRLRRLVNIDEMQSGFSPGKGTTDAIFIIRQVQEKFLEKKKELWLAFVDLEKAFDRVPREVLWWALRRVGVDEWLVNVVKSMYVGATTAVKLGGGESAEFGVKVGVHQGSVLSPLLFNIVLEALSNEFRAGLPWELLYADDLALMAETKEELLEKLERWKNGMERKGLRVNIGKTKVMKCCVNSTPLSDSGKWPCGVCRKGVGRNSVFCVVCKKWVHKKCSGVKGKLVTGVKFTCPVCVRGGHGDLVEDKELALGDAGNLQCVDKFCYLGDMLGCGGGAGDAVRYRVRCAWGKFRELAPILTVRGMSLRMKGKIYVACVQSVMVYGSETWALKVSETQQVVRAERMMVRWMCGVSLKDRKTSQELLDRLAIVGVEERLRRCRLRWFGHVERKSVDDWVSKCRKLVVEGPRSRGRGRKTWRECIDDDMVRLNLQKEDAQDRVVWRNGILGFRPTRASAETRTLNRR
jgi:Reverse transcriptase (RNA-dependent DNA polymerase)